MKIGFTDALQELFRQYGFEIEALYCDMGYKFGFNGYARLINTPKHPLDATPQQPFLEEIS